MNTTRLLAALACASMLASCSTYRQIKADEAAQQARADVELCRTTYGLKSDGDIARCRMTLEDRRAHQIEHDTDIIAKDLGLQR